MAAKKMPRKCPQCGMSLGQKNLCPPVPIFQDTPDQKREVIAVLDRIEDKARK